MTPAYLGPTGDLAPEDWAAIGRLIGNFALVEHLMDELLARMAGAPSFPALAVIDKLTAQDRADAAKALLDMHRRRYRYSRLTREQCEEIAALFREADSIRARRNEAAHWIWSRAGDGLFAHRFRGEQARDDAKTLATRAQTSRRSPADFRDGWSRFTTRAELDRVADQAAALSDRLLSARSYLPEVSEAPQ